MTASLAEADPVIASLDPAKIVNIDLGSEDLRRNFIQELAGWAKRPPFYAVHGGAVQVVCARYADVMEVFQDRARFTTELPRLPGFQRYNKYMEVEVLTVTDGERHDRLRRLMNPAFSPPRIATLRDEIVALVDRLLDGIERRGGVFDAQNELAQHVMPSVLLDIMFRLSEPQKAIFRRMSDVVPLATRIPPGGDFPEEFRKAFSDCRETINELIEERRARPGEDFISALIATAEDGVSLTPKELFDQIFTIVVASLQSTASSLCAVLWTLGRHPDQLQLVKDDPALIPQAIEECLRYHGAGFLNFARFALVETEVGGTRIPTGVVVRASSQAACLDEAFCSDPLKVDILREAPKGSPLFGSGVHVCLGNRLARTVLRLTLERMVGRFPKLRLDDPQFHPTYRGQAGETQIAVLPMRFD